MDRGTIIGIVSIAVIFFGYTFFSSQQNEKYQAELAEYNARQAEREVAEQISQIDIAAQADSVDTERIDTSLVDGVGAEFAPELLEVEEVTLSNEVMDVKFSTQGGQVVGVTLKDYYKYSDDKDNRELVQLFEQSSAMMDFEFYVKEGVRNIKVNTSQYIFKSSEVEIFDDYQRIVMSREFAEGASLNFVYTLYNTEIAGRNYLLDFDIELDGMTPVMANQNSIGVKWRERSFQNERGFQNENNYTTIAYHYRDDSSNKDLGMSDKNKSENSGGSVEWVAFKQQFFSSVFIAKGDFSYADMSYSTAEPNSGYIKDFSSDMALAYNNQTINYQFGLYYGPNKYNTLCEVNDLGYGDLNMQDLIPLGWGIFGWVNKFLVIPVFNFLNKYIASFGLIIFILAILVKLITLLPTLSSYKSMAKMRVIKPRVDEINNKYPKKEDMQKRQAATMELYKKAGVNPMGGCIPMLVQMPIIFAIFRFFPSSIDLRGASFLWSHDLASYDSILNLPFTIPFYGDHVSLFALLMAVSMFFYSKMNMNQNASSSQPEMASMNFMMLYMMPVMMLLWFNNYSSGLCYYYLLANLITMIQTGIIRRMVNDDKILAQINAYSKSGNGAKKSKFQQRYEAMAAQVEAENKKRNSKK